MSQIVSRPAAPISARWGVLFSTRLCLVYLLLVELAGCGPPVNRYVLIEDSLRANNPKRADAIVEGAEKDYGSKSVVLYGMDRGMMLQLAGDYKKSNAVLEQAEDEVDRLYTRRIRTETAAFLTNDNLLPYEGDPYEQVLINVLKAINYVMLGAWEDALVEARRIDHKLNVLWDRTPDKNAYRDDGFARYLTGILYESTGDLNNAFIAYRRAYEAFEASHSWLHLSAPTQLRADLLRTADAMHLSQEFMEYQRLFPDATWESSEKTQRLAQVVVISYNGRAPRKEDQFLDVPISLDALQLVLLNRGFSQSNRQNNRVADSVLYGLNGRVVRVALPRLVPQQTQVKNDPVTLTSDTGVQVNARTEVVQSVTALAEKTLSERLPGITVKALARATVKFSLAEGAARGAQQAAGKDAGPWVGLAVGLLAHGLAVGSEEADKRSWETLPDEIHLARLWVTPGQYHAYLRGPGQSNEALGTEMGRELTLDAGRTVFLFQRVMP